MDNKVDTGNVNKVAVVAAIVIMAAILGAGFLGIPLS